MFGAVTPLALRLPATNFGSPHGVTEQSKQMLRLWHLTYYIGIPLGLIVFILIVWCMIRYRRRAGSERHAAQFQYHLPLEVLYTVVPIILVAVIFAFMYGAENKVDKVSKNPAVVVNVEGFQWGWRFTYPDSGLSIVGNQERPPTFAVPTGTTVRFVLRSRDVVHAFWVPDLRFKRDAFPSFVNRFDLVFAREGTYTGRCAEFCGLYHSDMGFAIEALAPERFGAWLREQGAEG